MVPPLFVSVVFLTSFCAWGCARAALVNRTIEDFDPLMQYNCTVQRCDANSTNVNPCNATNLGFIKRTLTVTAAGCQIIIPFVGTAVYAFMACLACQFEVDKTVPHSETRVVDGPLVQQVYFNNTLPNDIHTLVVTSPRFSMDVDYVIYTCVAFVFPRPVS
ncbi:hypothetical protein B0H19DRAFT_572730 [Mycena capillaripes]|nr:hypothetical protein B0H19DRAFT_572730 [Mycena capillaripes]